MDMSIQLKSETGAICTLSLSFNNDGPLGTFFRYIGDNGTWIARYDDPDSIIIGRRNPGHLAFGRRVHGWPPVVGSHGAAGEQERRQRPQGRALHGCPC